VISKKIRCAIVGLGRIGSTLEDDEKREKPASHAGAIHDHPETILVAGCDLKVKSRDQFKERWSISKIYSSCEPMLNACEIDILHIATPPQNHFESLKLGLEHNIPVIICEKPLAADIKEAEKMLHLVESSPTKVIVNHERRYSHQFVHTRQLISDSTHGQLLSIFAKLYMGIHRKISEVLYDDATHIIDLLRYLTNCDLKIQNVMGKPKAKEFAVINILAGETPVVLEVAGHRDHVVFELDLSFAKGRVRVGNGLYEEYISDSSPYYEKMRSLRLIDKSFQKTEYFKAMFADAVKCFKQSDWQPGSTAQDAFDASSFIERILEWK